MRRIGRYILNGLTVLSLVLCVAMVGLWVRSYRRDVKLGFILRGERCEIRASCGRAGVDNGPQLDRVKSKLDELDAHLALMESYEQDYNRDARRTLAQRRSAVLASLPRPWERTIRLELLTIAMAALPTMRALRRTLRRRGAGSCSKCGYDLRATPDRCPECGTIPTKVKVRRIGFNHG